MTPRPGRGLANTERALLAVAVAGALGWGVALAAGAAAGGAIVAKGATVGALALLAFGRRRELPGGALLAVALAAHCAGDLLLETSILVGMAAFFVGHLLDVALFWSRRRAVGAIGGASKLALGLLFFVAAACLALLAARLRGVFAWAVPLYALALVAMAGTALLSRRGRPWLPAGALAFVVSDALLSFQLFGSGAAGGGRLLVWPLYAAGQFAIAIGWIFGPEEEYDPDDELDDAPGVAI